MLDTLDQALAVSIAEAVADLESTPFVQLAKSLVSVTDAGG